MEKVGGDKKNWYFILLILQAVELIHPVECLKWYPVSTAVNNSRNKSPECMKQIDPTWVCCYITMSIVIEVLFDIASLLKRSYLLHNRHCSSG